MQQRYKSKHPVSFKFLLPLQQRHLDVASIVEESEFFRQFERYEQHHLEAI
jgi:hypothetical protein